MKITNVVIGSLIGALVLSPSADAALVLVVQSPVSDFSTNTGIQYINVFASGDGMGSDSGLSLIADFSLPVGVSFESPIAGIYGDLGYIGNGNLFTGGSSFLRDPSNANLANLSIEFTATQSFSPSGQLLAKIAINTDGLAAGTYEINIDYSDLEGVAGTNTGATFNVIPEPGSLTLIAAFGVLGIWVRKRR